MLGILHSMRRRAWGVFLGPAAPYKQTEKGRYRSLYTYYAKLSYSATDVLIDERVLGQI